MERRLTGPATHQGEGIALGRAALQALILSTIANLVIFYVTNAVADDNIIAPNTGDELPMFLVIFTTAFYTAGAVGVYWLVVRRLGRSLGVFRAISFVALVLTFLPVFLYEYVETVTSIALSLMHLVSYVIIMASLSGFNVLRR
jgi:hypothetical protein